MSRPGAINGVAGDPSGGHRPKVVKRYVVSRTDGACVEKCKAETWQQSLRHNVDAKWNAIWMRNYMLLTDEAGVFSTGSDGNGQVGSGATE